MATVGRNFLLAGRFALVTGGGSGIGRAVCALFAREGAKVAVADLNESTSRETVQLLSQESDGSLHSYHSVDVGRSESVTALFASLLQKHGRCPDAVVNCAGITRDCFLSEMTESMYDQVMEVNAKGTFLVTQAACRAMMASGTRPGTVVNISSIVGKVGNMGQCNYAASKAAVLGMTKSVAKEMAKHGIRCNAVVPGFIDTPMVATVPEKVMEGIMKLIPMGRAGTPEEVAEVCAFLTSERSSYVTGAAIEVTGGVFM